MQDWLAKGYHGSMEYMARHGLRRARPAELVPGTSSIIVVRMNYLPGGREPRGDGPAVRDAISDHDASTNPVDAGTADDAGGWIDASWASLADPRRATVSRYAHGRDYHKVLRARLQRLADRIADVVGPFGHRVFTDSAPVMEVELARRAGLGWRGKHTLLLSRAGGSMFFLGELFVDLALPVDAPVGDHCGSCTRCIDACPTGAIVAPHVLDARRCISYLTIEHDGPIPEALRPAIGNRIYGCDDCQLVCPWNRYAERAPLPDFDAQADRASHARRGVRVERDGLPARDRGQRDPPHRSRALAAQRRGRARQRARVAAPGRRPRGDPRRARGAMRRRVAARPRARRVGARARSPRRHRAARIHSGSVTTDSTVLAEMMNATTAPLPPIRTARM